MLREGQCRSKMNPLSDWMTLYSNGKCVAVV